MDFNRRLRSGILAIVVACSIGFGLYQRGTLGTQKVVTVKVEAGNLKPTVFGIGTVQAKKNYNIGPTQTSRILKLYVDQGDLVKAGQVLGEVDSVDLEQNITSSNAALASSQHDAATARMKIQDVRSQNKLAQAEAARYAKLFESGAVSKEVVDSKQTDAVVAQATLDSAVSAFQSAQSKVEQAAAEYGGKLEQRRNFLLISPVDGVIVSRTVEPGSTVVAGQAVFTIIDPKTLWVQTRIDQTRFSGVTLGQRADVVLRSNQNEVLHGTIERLEVQGDTVTEERFVDVKFTELTPHVFLGDLANVTINLPEARNVLYIPATAIKTTNGEDGVWVVQNGKTYYKAVKTGVRTLDGKVEISSGLEPEETVVLSSKTPITVETKVRMVSTL